MRELSLFTGGGGGLLAGHLLGWMPVGYVEWDEYCQRVIAQRIKDGMLPEAPIFGDIRAFIDQGYASAYRGMVDVVSGGFPCQPFSVAGKRAGADDERNMWPATLSVIQAVRPKYVFLENVPGLLSARSYRCICGWPDRWGGTHRNPVQQGQTLLRRDNHRYVRESNSITQSGNGEVWRNNSSRQKENEEMGRFSEMAYWWGRSVHIPSRNISVPDVESASGGDCSGTSGVTSFTETASQRNAEMDGCGEGKGRDYEEQDSRNEPEGSRCPVCGRRLVQTDSNAIWYMGEILRSLAESGYDARWRILSAAEVGAPHRRDRLWIVAIDTYTRNVGALQKISRQKQTANTSRICQDVAHTAGIRCAKNTYESRNNGQHKSSCEGWLQQFSRTDWWQAEPDMGRVADGMAARVDRLRTLGNGQVPLVAATAWRLLTNDL